MFLEHQIGILEWFLKDHVTLKTVIGSWKINFVYIYIFVLYLYTLQTGLGGTDMALALNRYICVAVLPLLSKYSSLLCDSSSLRSGLVDELLQGVYSLSKANGLTKAQRDAIQDCLLAVCGWGYSI